MENRIPAGKYPNRKNSKGFTFIALLVALLILSLATQIVLLLVSEQAKRDRIDTQMKIVDTYAAAITAYYNASPGTQKQYPEKLEDLLIDKRQLTTKRYLRKLYSDPLHVNSEIVVWGLDRDSNGRITRIYSVATPNK